jgi:hypothetical protein
MLPPFLNMLFVMKINIHADNMIKANVRPDVNKVGRSKTNANKQTHAHMEHMYNLILLICRQFE